MKQILPTALAALLTLSMPELGMAQRADDAYLKFDPIVEGESRLALHLNEIALEGFRSNLTRNIPTGVAVPGAKAQFAPLKVYKYIDKASVPLMVACALGTKYKSATLTVVRTRQNNAPYDAMKIVLTDVFVSGVDEGNEATDGEGNLLEMVTLSYSKIEWTYIPLDNQGNPVLPGIKGGWDLVRGVRL